MKNAFTLVELLVVIAVIAIVAGLLFPALNDAKGRAERTVCANNLRQIGVGIRMYCDDSSDSSPAGKVPWIAYKELMKNYVGLRGKSSANDRIFTCPADTFCYEMARGANGYYNVWTNYSRGLHEFRGYDYSSYSFNGFNAHTADNPQQASWRGIAQKRLGSIRQPAKTVLVGETAAFIPYSWHQPRKPIQLGPGQCPMFPDARDVLCFVDGHVNYTRIYYSDNPGNLFAVFYDPPDGYDYKWSGD
ncbi:MAG TPA: prepilin-type N-terminal cleavage/methylation domain-containing protein [Alphaproteobacteria bacterium]|nr:prepilin-type N-terminal cleavage/methylation domain-containing protein [Alphaproteobacteria bacterium]